MEHNNIILCQATRVSRPRVAGSITAKCDDCSEDVWISSAVKEAAESIGNSKIVCIGCGFLLMIKDDGSEKAIVTPEQSSINAFIRRKRADNNSPFSNISNISNNRNNS